MVRINACVWCLPLRSGARDLTISGPSRGRRVPRVLTNSGITASLARIGVCACVGSRGGGVGAVVLSGCCGCHLWCRAGRLGADCPCRGPAGLSVHVDRRLALIKWRSSRTRNARRGLQVHRLVVVRVQGALARLVGRVLADLVKLAGRQDEMS